MSVISSNLTDGTIKLTGTLTSSASLNSVLVNPNDTSGYSTISVQLTGNWEASVIFQSSNDNITWVNTQGYAFNSSMTAIDTAVNNDIYLIPVVGKYFQVIVQGLNGTINAVAYLRTQSMAGLGEAMLTQAMDSENNATLNIGFSNYVGSGQQAASNSFPVALANEQILDKVVVGAVYSSSVPLNTNMLLDVNQQGQASRAPIDCLQYRSIYLTFYQSAAVTAGAVAFEGSNDSVNWVTVPLYSVATTTVGATSTVYTISVSGGQTAIYDGPILYRYFRVRVSTAIASATGVTFQAIATLRMSPYTRTVNTLTNLSQLNSATIPTTTSMTSSGTIGISYSTLPIGGGDKSIIRSEYIGAPSSIANYTGNPYARQAYCDVAGAFGVAGVQPFLAEDKTYPVNVRLERATRSQESVQDMLAQILSEIKALNYYIRELPNALSTNSSASMSDESDNFYQ
jgi:hypothetical protein